MQHSTRGYWITFINKLVVAAFLLYYTVVIRPVALLWRGFIFEEISEWIAHKIREVVFTVHLRAKNGVVPHCSTPPQSRQSAKLFLQSSELGLLV